jgi:hypothetical protein
MAWGLNGARTVWDGGLLSAGPNFKLTHYQILAFAPGCEEAWFNLAKLTAELRGEKQHAKQLAGLFDQLFVVFARFPDFTWKIVNAAPDYGDVKQRLGLYERLVVHYENSGRPDLACEARLKLADLLAAQDRPLDAIQGLAFTIRKFPGEGRYVPKMLDRLEGLCDHFHDGPQHLVRFYADLLPLVPKTRGGTPTPYAIAMFKRAANAFTRCGEPALAQAALLQARTLESRQPGN